MTNIEYTNTSYQLANKLWVPQARERIYYGDRIEEKTISWKNDDKFSTKEEVDAFVEGKIAEIKQARNQQ